MSGPKRLPVAPSSGTEIRLIPYFGCVVVGRLPRGTGQSPGAFRFHAPGPLVDRADFLGNDVYEYYVTVRNDGSETCQYHMRVWVP
jgi:hypothetical protein